MWRSATKVKITVKDSLEIGGTPTEAEKEAEWVWTMWQPKIRVLLLIFRVEGRRNLPLYYQVKSYNCVHRSTNNYTINNIALIRIYIK